MHLYFYSGDFGDFASFVAHMKQIAVVRVFCTCFSPNADVHLCDIRRRTSTCYWSTLVTSTMVRNVFSFPLGRLTLRIGTGLSDGFPHGGIDAHDVRLSLPHRVQCLTVHSPTSFSPNCPMTC